MNSTQWIKQPVLVSATDLDRSSTDFHLGVETDTVSENFVFSSE